MRRVRYRATLDRAGWALALGGGLVGVGVVIVALASGTTAPPALAGLGIGGTVAGRLAIAGLGGPVWLAVPRRGPVAAGVTGAIIAAFLTLAVLTKGFGAALPVADAATLSAIWTSAAASSAVAGFLGALIALAMWLVSYRAG
ncbi:MAG: hypothetical protein V4659_00795 [Pseudomonadota bacterium]